MSKNVWATAWVTPFSTYFLTTFRTRAEAWNDLLKVWFREDEPCSRRTQIRRLRRKGLKVLKVHLEEGWENNV